MSSVDPASPEAGASNTGRVLTIHNILNYGRERLTDLLGLLAVSVVVLSILNYQAFRAQPLSYSDLTVPYLYGTPGLTLSISSPWYAIFTHFAFEVFQSNLGYVVNGVDILSYSLAPVGMYVLLDQLRLSRVARIGGSLFFLFNPFTLDLAAGYLQYSTFWFAAPVIIALLVRYDRSNRFADLLAASLLTFVLLQLNPFAGIRLIAPIAIGFWILPLLTRRVKSLLPISKDVAIAFGTLFGLSVAGSYFSGSLNILGYWFSSGSNTGSSLYQFTISQIQFTYQGQTFLNSLTLLTVYPGSNVEVIGYTGTWPWVVWILALAGCLAAGVTRASYRRGQDSRYYTIFLVTLISLVGFEVGVSSGILIPAFKTLPFLLEYEYPDVLHRIEIVIYAVFFGAFISELPRVLRAIGKRLPFGLRHRVSIRDEPSPSSFDPPTAAKHFARRFRKPPFTSEVGVPIVILAAALIVLPSVSFVVPDQAERINPTTNANNYLPGYFGQIGDYLHSLVGDSRVLPLPLNYSTIIELYSAVPQGRIFGIPYAGLNNPGAYPSPERVSAVLNAVKNQNSSQLAELLALNNIEYVVLFNPGSATPISLISDPYDPYLNGGGGVFLAIFQNAANFSRVLSTANFVILRDDQYSAPLIEPGSAYLYQTLAEGSRMSSISTGLLQNSNLTSRTGWGQWTSCNGSQAQYISYTGAGGQLSTCPLNQTFTGARSQTEIYQWTNLTPYENLTIRGRITTSGNLSVNLIAIFHNASNLNWSRVFYTNNQTFPAVTPAPNGTFEFHVTSPSDTVGGVFGIQDFGPTSGPAGTALVESIDVIKTFGYPTYYSPGAYPFEQLSTLVLPLTEQTAALSSYAGHISGIAPSNVIAPSEANLVSDDSTTGAVYFPSGSWILNLSCPLGANTNLLVLSRPVSATGTLTTAESQIYVITSGWSAFPMTCSGGEADVTLTVRGVGSMGIEALLEV
jgi:hypothetical protein